jgi:N-acetylglucosamine-6-sulfatase
VTFPRLLQAAGYDTAFVGKWHVGSKGQGGRLPGFDEVTAYKSQGRYLDNVFRSAGERVPTEGFVDDRVTDFAIEFISREREAPFLVCVGFKSAHRPRTPAPRHAGLYAEAEFEPPPSYASLPPFPRRTEWAELSRRAGERVLDVPDEDWAEDYGERWPMVLVRDRSEEQRDYLRLVTALDENVSRLLATLDELGLADDTLVIYASDHGFLEAEHGLNGKGTAYEGSMRTVLLMRYPRFAPRGAEARLALSVDVAPTVLELAGVERPEGLEGRSLVPLLRGDDDLDWRQEVLYEFYQGRMYGGFPTTLAVRGERHKLITYPGYPSWTELYDLEADPHEMVDLADEGEHAGLRARMERRLEALEAELGGARPLERPSKDTPSRNPAREAGRDADQDE